MIIRLSKLKVENFLEWLNLCTVFFFNKVEKFTISDIVFLLCFDQLLANKGAIIVMPSYVSYMICEEKYRFRMDTSLHNGSYLFFANKSSKLH